LCISSARVRAERKVLLLRGVRLSRREYQIEDFFVCRLAVFEQGAPLWSTFYATGHERRVTRWRGSGMSSASAVLAREFGGVSTEFALAMKPIDLTAPGIPIDPHPEFAKHSSTDEFFAPEAKRTANGLNGASIAEQHSVTCLSARVPCVRTLLLGRNLPGRIAFVVNENCS